jgi:putative tryptophan/tyrosine transport system substrate-binding protein
LNRRDLLFLGGAAIAWPTAARAQQAATPVIGYLSGYAPGQDASYVTAFLQGLGDTGFSEGRNVRIEYRWAEWDYDCLPGMVADLVGRKVDLIAATGGNAPGRAAKSATSTIPIVFATGGDPIQLGLVTSLARPDGNVTGFSFLNLELNPKRLELISELVPSIKIVALLVNPNNASVERIVQDFRKAASAKGTQLLILKASNEREVDTAFATLVQGHAGGLVIMGDPFFLSQREQIVALATRRAVPTIYQLRDFAASGGLISYGPSYGPVYRQVGVYAGRILKGAKPADLPVQQPTNFELVVNLKTAKALGLAVPQLLLAQADEVIE